MSLDCLFCCLCCVLGEFLINKSNNKRQKTSYHCTLPKQNVFSFVKVVTDCTAHFIKKLGWETPPTYQTQIGSFKGPTKKTLPEPPDSNL